MSDTSPSGNEGIVLVLIPAGTFWMGASENETEPNYDVHAMTNERPVQEVRLDAFFISKYEMTQEQWSRTAGTDPSIYDDFQKRDFGEAVLLHPVENVTWSECEETLRRLGLVLPTEAQWEYAARAGRITEYSWGIDEIGTNAMESNWANSWE